MQDRIEYKTVSFSVEEEDIPPPPSGFNSKFKTLEAWLTALCDAEKPLKANLDYGFGLFESKSGYTAYLVGKKEYQKNQNESIVKIEFEPKNMYFDLPKKEYEGLTNEQVRKRLFEQLLAFSKTSIFQNSFFSNAATVKTEWRLDTIWKRKG